MRPIPLVAAGAVALATLTAVGATAPAAHAAPGDYAYALSGTNLLTFDLANPTAVAATAITGVAAGETLVGLDVRPQNGQLYALGVNATTNTGTVCAVSEQTGVVGAVGAAGAVGLTTNGVTQVDLPDPATVGYGFDFNPSADRIRVTAGNLNFRVDPNSGQEIDGDNTGLTAGNVSGNNPDGPVGGATSTVDSTAYTNNVANNGGVTTLYTLDAASNALYRQVPANVGTQVSVATVTLGGSPLDFTGVTGFDISAGVNAASNNVAVSNGSGYAALTVGGTTRLYAIDLVTGAATALGAIGSGSLPVTGLALQRDVDEGYPVVGLSADGMWLVRFSTATPGTSTSQAISLGGLGAGEDSLAAIAWRPQTGQLVGLGVNDTTDTASLYVVDPQTGALTAIGATGSLAWTESDGVTLFDLPNPALRPYAMDVNPAVDRVRITAGADLNARANPNTGTAIDGNTGTAGTNPDGATGTALSAVSYTNSYGNNLAGSLATTLYGISAVPDQVVTVNPPNAGVLTNARTLTQGGTTLDFAALAGFDIPEDLPGTAYAALTVGGQPGLYTVDLATGAATSIGNLASSLRSLTLGQAGANRPVVAPPPPPPPPAATPATLTKVGKAKQQKKTIDTGRSLACPATFATATCTTKIRAIAAYQVKVKGKKRTKKIVVATRTVTTAKGSSTRLKVSLSKKGYKLLAQRKTLAVTVAITAPTGAAAAAQTTRVKVKLTGRKLPAPAPTRPPKPAR